MENKDLPTVESEWQDVARDMRERGWSEEAITELQPIFYYSLHLTVRMVVRAAHACHGETEFGDWLGQVDAEALTTCVIAIAQRRVYGSDPKPEGRRPWDPDGKIRSSLAGAAFVVIAVLAYAGGTLLDVANHAESYCQTKGYGRYEGLEEVHKYTEGGKVLPVPAAKPVARAAID